MCVMEYAQAKEEHKAAPEEDPVKQHEVPLPPLPSRGPLRQKPLTEF